MNTINVSNIIEEGRLGGPQVRIARVASSLTGPVNTTIIMPQKDSQEFQDLCVSENLAYTTLPIHRLTKDIVGMIKFILFFPVEILRIFFFFKRGQFDVVHVSGGSWQYKGVIAGRLAGIKVLWHLNDTSSRSWMIRHAFKRLSRFTDGYIFASERSRSYYANYVDTVKPYFVIPAPVDTVRFDPSFAYSGDEKLIEQWQGKVVVGTVANINPVKDLETFIRSTHEVNHHFDDVIFIVIGRVYDSQRKYFERMHELCRSLGIENLFFVEGRKDVRPLLKRMDIYVCSSRAESSPVSVWEAMSMAKPIVSTDVGDVPLYVHDNRNGYIIDVGDYKDMTRHIITLVQDKSLREKFGQLSRETAIQQLDIQQCAQSHLNAYSQINDA